jgi:hypothetical protein
MEGAGNFEKRPPVAETHYGRLTLKRTTALKTNSPKMGAVGGQQRETNCGSLLLHKSIARMGNAYSTLLGQLSKQYTFGAQNRS